MIRSNEATRIIAQLKAENDILREQLGELCTLLDRIELEDDASIAGQRFELFARYGVGGGL